METQRGCEWQRAEQHHSGCHVNTYGQLPAMNPVHQYGNARTMQLSQSSDGQSPDCITMLGKKQQKSPASKLGRSGEVMHIRVFGGPEKSGHSSHAGGVGDSVQTTPAHDVCGARADDVSASGGLWAPSNTPMTSLELLPGTRTPSPRTSVSQCMSVEPSICLEGVPCRSSLAGDPDPLESCSNGIVTPQTTPRNSINLGDISLADSGPPNSLCEEPSTPRSEQGTPRGLYSDAIRRLEQVYISGEDIRSSADPFEALTPRRRGLASLLRPGSGSSTPRSHSEKKRVSQLLKQNKPSMLRNFLCPRVQTGSAAHSEAAVQADESVSSGASSKGAAESVSEISRDDTISIQGRTSRLHYQQVTQSTVIHDCAAYDLQATPRAGPGALGKSSKYVLAWTPQTGFFLREVEPGLDNGADQALKILQDEDIQALVDTVQTVPANSASPDSPSESCAPQESSMACSDEAWNATPGSECCSPPRIGSVSASYDSANTDPHPGADQHLKGLSALRTLAAKKLAREPEESITIGDWIMEAVASEGLAGEQREEKRLLVPVKEGEQPEERLLVSVKEWELQDERLLVPVKEEEEPDESRVTEASSVELSERRLAEPEDARPAKEDAEAFEESGSLCETSSADAEPLLDSWKPAAAEKVDGLEERRLDELSIRTFSPLKEDWHAADREVVEALITATDRRAAVAVTSTVSLSSLVSESRDLTETDGGRGSCTALTICDGKGPRKGKKGGSKGKAPRKGAAPSGSARAPKPEGYANRMLRVPPGQRAKNTKPARRCSGSSFGAWSAESSLNTSLASIPAAAQVTKAKPAIAAPPKKPVMKDKKSPGRVSPRAGTPSQRGYLSMLRASSPRKSLPSSTSSSSQLVIRNAEAPVAQPDGHKGLELDYDSVPPALPEGPPMDVAAIKWLSTSSPRKRGRTKSKSSSLATSIEVTRSPKSRLAATEAGEAFRVPCLMLDGQMGIASLDAESAADVNAQIQAFSVPGSTSGTGSSGEGGKNADGTTDEEPSPRELMSRPSERIVNLMDLDICLPSTPSVSPELKPLDTSVPGMMATCSLNDAADFDALDGLVPEKVASPSLSHTSDEDKTKLVARWWLKRSTSRARSSSGLGLTPKSLHCPSPLRDGSTSPSRSSGHEDFALIKLDSPDDEDEESWLTGNSSQIVSPAGNAEEESIQFVSAISIASEEDTF